MSTLFRGPEGVELARETIAELERRAISPSPQNYHLWASYVGKQDDAVFQDINEIIESGAPFTDAVSDALFEKHFGDVRVDDAMIDAGARIEDQIAQVMNVLKAAEDNTAAYGKTLEGASGQLSESSDAGAVKQMVDMLVAATQQMQRHSDKLERRLSETTQEVHQLRSNLETVREEAMTDALTGVANRKRFDQALAKATADGGPRPLALLMIDIDHFKAFNDTWGHQTGDQIIRLVASCLTGKTGDGHLVARYGGEEFAALLPGASPEEAVAIAEAMRITVEKKKLYRKSTKENLGKITVSIGVATLREGEDTWEFIERADMRLYESKGDGRNRVTSTGDQKAAQSAA